MPSFQGPSMLSTAIAGSQEALGNNTTTQSSHSSPLARLKPVGLLSHGSNEIDVEHLGAREGGQTEGAGVPRPQRNARARGQTEGARGTTAGARISRTQRDAMED